MFKHLPNGVYWIHVITADGPDVVTASWDSRFEQLTIVEDGHASYPVDTDDADPWVGRFHITKVEPMVKPPPHIP